MACHWVKEIGAAAKKNHPKDKDWKGLHQKKRTKVKNLNTKHQCITQKKNIKQDKHKLQR